MQVRRACQSWPWLLRAPKPLLLTCTYATRSRGRAPFARYERQGTPRNKLPADFLRKTWAEASNAELEKALAFMARNSHPERKLANVSRLVTYMHETRAIAPTITHYEAMILANTDAQGSASNVKQLLLRVDAAGLRGSGLIDNAVLQVLAVHPDPVMRQELLHKMAREWTELSPGAIHHNIAALLREGQLELAQTELRKLEASGAEVSMWLQSLLAHSLLQANDFDGLLAFLHRSHDMKIDLPRKTFSYLLDASVQRGNLAVVTWIWSKHVEPMFITPNQDCCMHIIALATAESQLPLAERARLVLSSVEPTAAKQADDMLEAAYVVAGMKRPNPQPSRSLHAIFAGHTKAFVDSKIVLDTPPIRRFVRSDYAEKKKRISEAMSKRSGVGRPSGDM